MLPVHIRRGDLPTAWVPGPFGQRVAAPAETKVIPPQAPVWEIKLQVGRAGIRCVHTNLARPVRAPHRGAPNNGNGGFDSSWSGQGSLEDIDLKVSAHFQPGGRIRLEGEALSTKSSEQLRVCFYSAQHDWLGTGTVLVPEGTDRVLVGVRPADSSTGPQICSAVVAVERLLPAQRRSKKSAHPLAAGLIQLANRSWDQYIHNDLRWVRRAGMVCAKGSPIVDVAKQVREHVSSDQPLMILGPSGAGKSRLAEYIHRLSPRRRRPLIRFNSSDFAMDQSLGMLAKLLGFGRESGYRGVPVEGQDGALQRADGSSLFLDELATLPREAQAALLLVLDGQAFYPAAGKQKEITADVRFILAMNQDLDAAIAAGVFHQAFIYRISTLQLHLPALRDRRADIAALIAYFCAHAAKPIRLDEKLFKAMVCFDWPGNVRQLEQFILALTRCRSLTYFTLDNLGKTLVNQKLVQGLAEAYQQYKTSTRALKLGPREELIVRGLTHMAADYFRQALGSERRNPNWDWAALADFRLTQFREYLAAKAGFTQTTWVAATNCFELLTACYRKKGVDAEKLARVILARVWQRLKQQKVNMSDLVERNRYETFRVFLGLSYDQVVYVAKGLD